ncbi:MAG: rhodanese-like domain-containing protein [Candidatus Rokuibacteriota bacterium]
MRRSPVAMAVAALLLTGASPAAPPDFPVSFISVDELKERLEQKARVDIIDVRTRAEYDTVHIRGARALPLHALRERASGIARSGLVVLY